MRIETPAPHLFLVHCECPEDLGAERQQTLVRELMEASARASVAVVLSLKPEVRLLDFEVSRYWHDVLRRMPLACLALATPSRAVLSAARGFAMANRLFKSPTAVEVFAQEEDAVRWAQHMLGPVALAATS
jgi:hypothetical protein